MYRQSIYVQEQSCVSEPCRCARGLCDDRPSTHAGAERRFVWKRSPPASARNSQGKLPKMSVAATSGAPATVGEAPKGTPTTVVERVVARLDARLSDHELFAVQQRLHRLCRARPSCAGQISDIEEGSMDHVPERLAVVEGMDVGPSHMPGTSAGWVRLLFGTPLYSAQLDGYENLNAKLVDLLAAERASSASQSVAKSLVGSGWRTDDHFLHRKDRAPIRQLTKALLSHAEAMTRYGQRDSFRPRLHLSGWAVWLDGGGSMREHVHPMSSYSGVYYAAVPDGMRGGCLRISDPRPGAQMVVLGAGDEQFMESRLSCPSPGMLLLFPSWLPHSVTPVEMNDQVNTTHAPRIAIAFNVFNT